MAVTWNKIFETSTTGKMPTTSTVQWSEGINAPSGLVELVQLRYNLTFADSPVLDGEISSLVKSMRIVLNGETVFDSVAGFASDGTAGPSQLNYVLNHIGGRVVEVPSLNANVREGYINIPLGRQTVGTVNRYEIIVDWAATGAGATISSGSMSYWIRYNQNTMKTTFLVPATTFNHSANSTEQVVIRVPQNVPAGSVVTAIAVLNDSEADEYESTGAIRINALSSFSIPIDMYRSNNGDLVNGLYWNKGNTNTDLIQTRATRLSGAIVIPVFGLTGGDVIATVSSTSTTTRRYLPIMTSAVAGKDMEKVRQTQPLVGNTASATLDGSIY